MLLHMGIYITIRVISENCYAPQVFQFERVLPYFPKSENIITSPCSS